MKFFEEKFEEIGLLSNLQILNDPHLKFRIEQDHILASMSEQSQGEMYKMTKQMADGHICAKCKSQENGRKKFKFCARCKSIYYCGKKCQKEHWKSHKKTCRELTKMRNQKS